jgi:hypothetical protein
VDEPPTVIVASLLEGIDMDRELAPNHAVVRRHTPTDTQPPAPFTASPPPLRKHPGPVFDVHAEVVWPTITADGQLKGPPRLQLRWEFKAGQSGRIVGFRRRNGFGSEGDYGEMIVNSRVNGEKPEYLDPGEYFYNFFTRKSVLGLFHVYDNDMQFAETIPSVANVINSMKQAIEFTELKQKFGKLTEPPKESEDPLEVWRRELAAGMASIDARCDAATEFAKQWEIKRQLIEASACSKSEKRRRLDSLNGMMQGLREKLEL